MNKSVTERDFFFYKKTTASAIAAADWLYAITRILHKLRLDDDAIKIAIDLHLGTVICQPLK